MKDKKNILIGVLIFAIMVMAVGYTTFSSSFAKGGQVNVTSAWDVAITNVKRVDQNSNDEINDASGYPSHTITTATLDTTLKNVGAWAEYEITITNKGSVDAELDTANILSAVLTKINEEETNESNGELVAYEITKAPDSLLQAPVSGEKQKSTTMRVKVKWDETNSEQTITSLEEKITINVVYKQAA